MKHRFSKSFIFVFIIALMCVFNFFATSAIQNVLAEESEGSTEEREWEAYYKADDYSKYTTPASENGLGGTLLKVKGIIVNTFDVAEYFAWELETEAGEMWLMAYVPSDEMTVSEGDELVCYGSYMGISQNHDNLPSVMITRYLSSKEEYANLAFVISYEDKISIEDLQSFGDGKTVVVTAFDEEEPSQDEPLKEVTAETEIELWEYLNETYPYIETAAGKYEFTFTLSKRTFEIQPYDYQIHVRYENNKMYELSDAMIIYSTETKEKAKLELKYFMERIAHDVLKKCPVKKFKVHTFIHGTNILIRKSDTIRLSTFHGRILKCF